MLFFGELRGPDACLRLCGFEGLSVKERTWN